MEIRGGSVSAMGGVVTIRNDGVVRAEFAQQEHSGRNEAGDKTQRALLCRAMAVL